MEKYLEEVLAGRESTKYILPFFWQHGEPQSVLLEEIEAMERANLKEFCVESRTHEEFGKGNWWEDFGFMLREAKKRGMRVWLLDDKHFPTGYANGWTETHPECRKHLLRMDYRDFAGPRKGIKIIPPVLAEGESFLSVVAYRRDKSGDEFFGAPIELTQNLRDGMLLWDIPEGVWRVYYLIRTHISSHYMGWIDMISPEGCQGMIDAVYEPHYEHFKEYFGNTFAGFFSDEPCMGNDGSSYHSTLGKPYKPVPWREDIPELIASAMGISSGEALLSLPMLFHPDREGRFHAIRMYFMDVITRLYSECFTKRLGDWCRAHNVLYIGHIIEDMGTHQRIGFGAGHFFRALQYEDMGGMDIVLNQIIPGMLDTDHAGPVCENILDPEFFNYYQGKLPTSQAHLTPHMKHRTMCEIFGAFGWAEGIPMQKMLTDHMLSNGINYYVPHAFTPKYPDPDCPPHFFARGMNPQAEAFGCLMNYMRRGCHMISDGVHKAPVSLLYTAEAEWSAGSGMLGRKAGKVLTRSQLDFDILWEDILPSVEVREENGASVLYAAPETYRALVIPESEFLSADMIRNLQRFADGGVPVIVTGENAAIMAPRAVDDPSLVLTGTTFVPLNELAAYLTARGFFDIELTPAMPLVRYHSLVRDGKRIYFIASEDIYEEARFTVTLPSAAPVRVYDPWCNRLSTPRQHDRDVELFLPRAGALFLVEDDSPAPAFDYFENPGRDLVIEGLAVSVCPSKGSFTPLEAGIGDDVTLLPGMDRFAGVIRYEFTAELTGSEAVLLLGEVGEIAKVSLNGKDLGYACAEPWTLSLADAVLPGKNTFRVDVINNLGHRERDTFSSYLPVPASGLIGPVRVR